MKAKRNPTQEEIINSICKKKFSMPKEDFRKLIKKHKNGFWTKALLKANRDFGLKFK